MIRIASTAVTIQARPESVPATPVWLGEVTLIAQYLAYQGIQKAIEQQVRFARRRFGEYDVIDFVAVLIGYALSGEPTLEAFYAHLLPFAPAYMALFGRQRLPHRSTLSRFLAALDPNAVEALRIRFSTDLLARSAHGEGQGGLWDRQGGHWLVFDVDGTRQAARQRAVPQGDDLPLPHRRLDAVCAPGYLGRKRGEVVRTRTTESQAHTHQWLGAFAGIGNGDYRGDLLQSLAAIATYLTAHHLSLSQGIVRLDGQYGDGAIVADIRQTGLGWIMRGKDSHLLNLPQVQERLQWPPDQQATHPESGIGRSLFDCPDLLLTAEGGRSRVIIATHPATPTPHPIGVTHDDVVYERFFTALPSDAFTATDVLDRYFQRGAFECSLADEDTEQDPDRWCSHTTCGQAWWQILAQWLWNLRIELGLVLHPQPLRLIELAPATIAPVSPPSPRSPLLPPSIPHAGHKRRQPDGTLRCPTDQSLYPQERRPEHDGSVRVLYAARLASCRPCPLRTRCQEHGTATKKPRRVSAVLWPQTTTVPLPPEPPALPATSPLLWGDGSRRQTRRRWMQWLRGQRVEVVLASSPERPVCAPLPVPRSPIAHWRLSWTLRLARNACLPAASHITITLFGIPASLATHLGLAIA